MKDYNKKKIILTTVPFYLPGFKFGGAPRTVANMIDHLSDFFDFKIISLNRDYGDKVPYSGIKEKEWQAVGKADVYYVSPNSRSSLPEIKQLLLETSYDIIYLNSFFSPKFSIYLLWLRFIGQLNKTPFVIAPRGELSEGSLSQKKYKKRPWLSLVKILGMFKDVIWHVSSQYEEKDVRRHFGPDSSIIIAPDFPSPFKADQSLPSDHQKTAGELKIIFLSNIYHQKNLLFALNLLLNLDGDIYFNIYGNVIDSRYWEKCQELMAMLPKNVKARYCGVVEHKEVFPLMKEHDLFFLPTLGENFGHVIWEAQISGCPVLISDKTFWRNLEENKSGWDISLQRPEIFEEVLQKCIAMDNCSYQQWRKGAARSGLEYAQNDKVMTQNKSLFESV